MQVYRVYESYHADDESGTYEYGTFSTLEKAWARLKAVWAEKKYPDNFKDSELSRSASGMWEITYISISPIEVDKDENDNHCGYT
jgi:hypothetical protein